MNLELLENYSLAQFTTFKIGGPARFFAEIKNLEDLKEAIIWTREQKISIKILGGGSNLLIADSGFDGLVLKLKLTELEKLNDETFRAGSGLSLSFLANKIIEDSFDFSWASGIPGTVGGAIRGNAGAFGGDCAQNIISVDYLDLNSENLELKTLNNTDCNFNYRHSIFKDRPNWIIISSLWKAPRADYIFVKNQVLEHLKYRKEKQPLEYPSAGSTFKNIASVTISPESRQKLGLNEPLGEWVAAGLIIEKTGLKGLQIGQAQISLKHSNFLINLGGAKAQDVRNLIQEIQAQVSVQWGIKLELEVELWGFGSVTLDTNR